MAFEQPCFKLGVLQAASDLSAKQYYFAKVVSGGLDLAGAGEAAIGVIQNKPLLNEAVELTVLGVTKVVAGAAITKGVPIASDSAGKAKAAVLGKVDTSDAGAAADPVIGSYVMGIALEAATADLQIISALILHLGVAPTTAA